MIANDCHQWNTQLFKQPGIFYYLINPFSDVFYCLKSYIPKENDVHDNKFIVTMQLSANHISHDTNFNQSHSTFRNFPPMALQLEKLDDLEDDISELLHGFEKKVRRHILHTVGFY